MKNKKAFLIFPHQLFKDTALPETAGEIYLIEEHLFFTQYKFHKNKLVFHRASMKYYANYLAEKNLIVNYIEATEDLHDIRLLIPHLANHDIKEIAYYDVCDNWLQKRISSSCAAHHIKSTKHPSPSFINDEKETTTYFRNRKKFSQTDFYIYQRKKLQILLTPDQKPVGGKWTYDAANRLKYPKNKIPPAVYYPSGNLFFEEAKSYVSDHFANNHGKISSACLYPITHEQSEQWLSQFLEQRFYAFGEYEDAIVKKENILHHSVLTPMLNTGLLLPMQIVEAALVYATENNISINSLEGFIRQIIGWREFIRGVYVVKGSFQRNANFWNFHRKIPDSFYDGSTGIQPIDDTIKKINATGYCHHIERLMILGNFMLLNEFHPNEIYTWFMEMFIDAYDWVMVPNIYGMSQFADGGIMSTKPYISSSSYILKMSDYTKEAWCELWDGLFWRFMHQQRDFFLSNPRLGMLIKTLDKMNEDKKNQLFKKAEAYLNQS